MCRRAGELVRAAVREEQAHCYGCDAAKDEYALIEIRLRFGDRYLQRYGGTVQVCAGFCTLVESCGKSGVGYTLSAMEGCGTRCPSESCQGGSGDARP